MPAYRSICRSARSAGPRGRRRALQQGARRAAGVPREEGGLGGRSSPPDSPSAAPTPGSTCSGSSALSRRRPGCASPGPNCLGLANVQGQHLGDRVLAHARRADRTHRPRVPERRDRVRPVPAARRGRRHRPLAHHLDRQRDRPRLLRFRALPRRRPGDARHRRLRRRLQERRASSSRWPSSRPSAASPSCSSRSGAPNPARRRRARTPPR